MTTPDTSTMTAPDDLDGIRGDDLERVRAALLDEAEQLSRSDLTGEQLARFEQIEQLVEACADRRDRSARLLLFATTHGESGSGPDAHGARQRAAQPTRDRSGARGEAFELLRRNQAFSDELRDRVATMVEHDESDHAARTMAAAADPDYATAWGKVARDPMNGHRSFTTAELAAWQRAELVGRALDLSAGSAMIPTHLDPSIMISSDGSVDPMRQVARVVTITTTTWNGVSSEGVTTRWAAEATEANDDSPTFDDPSVDTHKADSFVPISLEALGDMTSVESELRRLFSDAKAQHETPAFIHGTGDGQPQGLVTGLNAPQTVETAAAGAFASGDVYNLLESLPARFRPNARWLASLPIINELDQMETGNGAKRFPRVGDTDPVLLRRPLHEHSEVSGEVSAGNHVLVVGDFRHYVLVDRTPAAVELVPHLFGTNRRPTGQRGFYMWWRVGGAPVVPNAFRRLEIAA